VAFEFCVVFEGLLERLKRASGFEAFIEAHCFYKNRVLQKRQFLSPRFSGHAAYPKDTGPKGSYWGCIVAGFSQRFQWGIRAGDGSGC
jgi:hypothetical protein